MVAGSGQVTQEVGDTRTVAAGRTPATWDRRSLLRGLGGGGAALLIASAGAIRGWRSAAADVGVEFTEYALPEQNSLPGGIVSGADGAIWFYQTGANQIGRITMHGEVSAVRIPTAGASSERQGFLGAAGDGAIWYTANRALTLGRIAADGVVTEYRVPTLVRSYLPNTWPNPLLGVTPGADGAIWFTHPLANAIGRLAEDGTFSEFVLPNPDSTPGGIVTGPDGALWFTEITGNRIGRITTAGQLTEYPIPTENSIAIRLAVGPDGAIWYGSLGARRIGRLTLDG